MNVSLKYRISEFEFVEFFNSHASLSTHFIKKTAFDFLKKLRLCSIQLIADTTC